MHSVKNQENFSEEDKKGDQPREMDQIKHDYSSPKKGYKKLGSAGIEGSLYQIDLLTLVLLNGMRKVKNWRLSTEDKAAAQLDDLIFEHLPSESAILLQAKHKKDEKLEITYQDLMSVNKQSEFSLPKYFFSYQEVKSNFNVQNVIICSNLKLDEKTKNILKEESVGPDSVMHFEGAENICYGFSGCSLPRLEQIINRYQTKNLKNNEGTISDEDINDFLNHLKFFPNCLSDKSVENIIQQTISQVKFSENLNSKMIHIYIKKKMMDWFKEEKGRYLTEVEAKAFFCDLRSNKYCENLKLYDIRFKRTNLPVILQTQQKNEAKGKKKQQQQNEDDAPVKEPKRISHIIPDKEYMLNVVKICQALPTHHRDETLFVNPEETFEVQRQIIDAFEAKHYSLLVMVCPNNRIEETAVKEICDKLVKVLTAYKYKHVILIAEERNNLATQLKHANINHYEVITDSITFADLEETTQEKFKRKKLVNFQGSTMSLEQLITPSTEDDLNEIVNSNMLIKLARGDQFEVGLELPHPDNYYINRSFNRNDQNLSEEELWRSTEEKVILISDSAGMGKSSVLTSLGISIKSDNPHLWVIRMNLNNYTSIMKTALAEGRKSVSITDLLNSQEASKLKSEFGKKLLTTTRRVVLMLDGVDEISPAYTELVINLIRTSLAQANLAKIFVTARPHMSKEFREIPELHSFASEPYPRNHQEETADLKFFTLEPFSKVNQINFLIKYWTETLDLQDDARRSRCNIFAEALIENVSVWINEKVRNNFAGIPLQIRMLAEIFQESNETGDEELEWEGCKEFLSSSNEELKLPTRIDLTQLYKLFIDKKCDIFIKTSNPAGYSAAEEALKDKVEKCQEYHRALALKVIFDSDKWDLFTCYTNIEWPIPSRFEDNFLFRVGIVQRQGENTEFLHRTFAEFFVADCLLIELERKPVNKNLQQFFMGSILLWREFYVVRAFLDSRMQNVWHLVENNFCSYFHRNRISEELLARYFRAFSREGCARIMECLVKCIDKAQLKTLSNAVNKLHLMYDALSFATQYDHWNILKLLLGLNEKFNKGKDAYKLFLAFVVIYAVNNSGTFQFLAGKVDENISGRSAPELNEVAFMGRFGKVELWMEKAGADINIKDNARGAVSMSRLEAIKFVLEEIGVDINTKDNNGETALHIAAYWGKLEIVKYLVEEGANINAKNNEGETAILRAAYTGKLEIVRYFVEEAGADQNIKDNQGRSALDLAGLSDKLEIVTYLVEEALSDKNVKHIKSETALHEAALMGNLEIVKYLVEKGGADKNVRDSKGATPLHEAAHWGKLEIVKYLVDEAGADKNAKNEDGNTTLHEAALMDKLEIVKYLVEEAGADTNAKNSKDGTALHEAALSGNLEIVKYLVEITGMDKNATNNEGNTVLHEAAFMGRLEVVKYLVEAGAEKNVKNSAGATALHEAASMDKLGIVKYLVEIAGADKNAKNNEGETALHEAAFMGKLVIVRYLIEAGADKNVKNNEGETALHKATFVGKLEIVKYLVEEAGADKNVKNDLGYTALHEAAHMGELEIVKYLVEDAEADKNVKNCEGETALHTAAHMGELEIVKYLVEEAGANKNIKNNHGRKALRLAADQGYWKVVRFLSNSSRWVMIKMRTIQFFRRQFQRNGAHNSHYEEMVEW